MAPTDATAATTEIDMSGPRLFERAAALPTALWWIIGLSLAGRAIFAAVTPLIPDEAYAIGVGRSFSLSFFDHPPIGFWLPAIAEKLGAASPLAWRIPSLALGCAALWLLYLIGRRLGGERAGLWTAGLGALTPALVSAGTFILPDAPLDVFVLATLLALLTLAQTEKPKLTLWLAGGAALALAFASKYQAYFMPVAVLAWVVSSAESRRWLKEPGFYLAGGVAALGLAPTLIWNMEHGWASFGFQLGRAGHALSPGNFAAMALGQSLFLLPVIFAWCIGQAASRANWQAPEKRLMVMVALAPVVTFNIVYLFSHRSLPHWAMPGWICLLPLVGAHLAANPLPRLTKWNFVSAGVVYALLMGAALHLSTGWAAHVFPGAAKWDRTAPQVSLTSLRQALAKAHVGNGTDVILADGWVQAGYFAAALPDGPPVKVLGAAHHFAYMAGATAHGRALMLDIADASKAADRARKQIGLARAIDPQATALPPIPFQRGTDEHFRLLATRLTVPAGK